MENKLRYIYGRRVTPSVRILVLVVIILFALDLACASDTSSREAQTTEVGK